MSKNNDDYVIGSIEFKKNGSVSVVYYNDNQKDSELFELAYKYVIYCLGKKDWMENFVDEEGKKNNKKNKPNLRLIKTKND
jgi:hypothetical protein